MEKARLELMIISPAGAPITVANDTIEMLLVVRDKTITYQNSQKKRYTY